MLPTCGVLQVGGVSLAGTSLIRMSTDARCFSFAQDAFSIAFADLIVSIHFHRRKLGLIEMKMIFVCGSAACTFRSKFATDPAFATLVVGKSVPAVREWADLARARRCPQTPRTTGAFGWRPVAQSAR